MQIPFIVFIRALGLYLLFTIPALIVPFIYLFSAFLAVAYGLAAGIVFMLGYFLIAKCPTSYKSKWLLLFGLVPAGVTISYFLIAWLNAVEDLWGFNGFLVFPSVAIIAGWASLFASKKQIRSALDPGHDETQSLLNQ